MSKQYEESFWQTLWQFLPGIIKFFSIITLFSVAFNAFSIIALKTTTDDSYKFQEGLIRDYNYSYGKKDANVKVVYFLDLQCPACRANNPVMEQAKTEFKDKIEFVYKNFPIEGIHPYAKPAAKAAQAAGRQGKYFEYVNKVYENQEAGLSSDNLERLAKELDLDLGKWNQDKASEEINKEIDYDRRDGETVILPSKEISGKSINKVSATPTLIIMKDGEIVDWLNGSTIDELRSKLNNQL